MYSYTLRFSKLIRLELEQKSRLLEVPIDFHLFRLAPEFGNYVRGFGKADDFSGEELRQMVSL